MGCKIFQLQMTTPKANPKKAGRKPLLHPRITLTCRIDPETMIKIKAMKIPLGRAIDALSQFIV